MVRAAVGALLFISTVYANNMTDSFNEGRNVGVSNKNVAQSTLKGTNPNEIQGYQANPQQTRYYTGIRGSDPNISSVGMQQLNKSELGKTIRTSTINNPKDNISMESNMIKNSLQIQKNAGFITGGINGKKCVKQVLSKTNFTYSYCEKDQAINATCKNTSIVTWKGSRTVENKEITLTPMNEITVAPYGSWGRDRGTYYNFQMPENAKVTGYDFFFQNSYGWYGLTRLEFSLFGKKNSINANNYNEHLIKVRDLNVPVSNQSIITGNLIGFKRDIESSYSDSFTYRYFYKTIRNYLKIYYTVEVDTLIPELSNNYTCSSPIEMTNAVKVGEQCTQAGGNRTFVKSGKTFQVYSDCWEKTENYLVSEASDNECKTLDANPNCTVGERECLSSIGDYCTRFRLKYQCANTVKTDGYVCGDKFFCSDGSCADLEGSVNSDFGHAVSQLASLAQAGQDVGLDEQNLKAFTGKPMFCRKSGFGFSDCCKDSGWGHKLGVAQCNSDENALGRAKERKLVIYTGTFCDKKVLGKCIRRKSSYCVFDNKLARIIQYQGRSGQLGVGFGSAKNPDCRGLMVDELQQLDFNAMDYSDFYQELNENQRIPDKEQLIKYMRQSISQQLQE